MQMGSKALTTCAAGVTGVTTAEGWGALFVCRLAPCILALRRSRPEGASKLGPGAERPRDKPDPDAKPEVPDLLKSLADATKALETADRVIEERRPRLGTIDGQPVAPHEFEAVSPEAEDYVRERYIKLQRLFGFRWMAALVEHQGARVRKAPSGPASLSGSVDFASKRRPYSSPGNLFQYSV
jgi:hypothetical protein